MTTSEVWGLTVAATPEQIAAVGDQAHIRQIRVLARASSKAELARKLRAISVLDDSRTLASSVRWVGVWACTTGNAAELGAVTDERVYFTSDQHRQAPILPWTAP